MGKVKINMKGRRKRIERVKSAKREQGGESKGYRHSWAQLT